MKRLAARALRFVRRLARALRAARVQFWATWREGEGRYRVTISGRVVHAGDSGAEARRAWETAVRAGQGVIEFWDGPNCRGHYLALSEKVGAPPSGERTSR